MREVDVGKRACDIVFAVNIASSVHNVRTFLMLVYHLLNHPNKEVEDYAFQALNENFIRFGIGSLTPPYPMLGEKR